MLPNHAPLRVAEDVGTLATIYPDRIDLGLGRTAGLIADHAGRLARAKTATIRRTLISVPARLARSARRIILHLPEAWPRQV